MGLSRDSYRNPPQPDQLTRDLCVRIVDIAHVRRRFGDRRIHDLLLPQLPHVNHKRVYRLYRDTNLAVRTANGPEFTSRTFMDWATAHGVRHILIQPGRPMQNGYIESFNGKFRDECLNEQWFET